MRQISYRLGMIGLALIAGATPAVANTGLPMIAVAYPTFLLFFIPIVVIEWLRMRRDLGKVPRLLGRIALANGVSTVVGIPLTWMVLAAVEMILLYGVHIEKVAPDPGPLNAVFGVLVTSPWLFPMDGPTLMWILAFAFLVLLIPFFFASYWMEYAVMRICTSDKGVSKTQLKTAVWWGNIYSYLFLTGMILLYMLIYALFGKEVVGSILDFFLYKFPTHAEWAPGLVKTILTPVL